MRPSPVRVTRRVRNLRRGHAQRPTGLALEMPGDPLRVGGARRQGGLRYDGRATLCEQRAESPIPIMIAAVMELSSRRVQVDRRGALFQSSASTISTASSVMPFDHVLVG